MSVYTAGMHHRSFFWQISALLFILGVLLAAAVATSQHLSPRAGIRNSAGFNFSSERASADKVEKYELDLTKLRDTNKKLEDILAKGTDVTRTLNSELQDAKKVAGLAELSGPGVIVTLTDSKKVPRPMEDPQFYLIHQQDILEVINELRSSGAEAISVNGQRIVSSSAIRCVGSVAQINDVKKSSPFVITAIGEAVTLHDSLNIANGVLDNIRRLDPTMATSEKQLLVKVPAFKGTTSMKYAKPLKAPANEAGKKGE